jgi:hypothetical protein
MLRVRLRVARSRDDFPCLIRLNRDDTRNAWLPP